MPGQFITNATELRFQLANRLPSPIYRSTDLQSPSSGSMADEVLRPNSPSAEDAMPHSNRNLYKNGEFSLSASFEFVHNSLSCSNIGDYPIEKTESGADLDMHAPDLLTQMYLKILDDIKIALTNALVPVVHTQVSVWSIAFALHILTLMLHVLRIPDSIASGNGESKSRRGNGTLIGHCVAVLCIPPPGVKQVHRRG